jgi:hypothetical protein
VVVVDMAGLWRVCGGGGNGDGAWRWWWWVVVEEGGDQPGEAGTVRKVRLEIENYTFFYDFPESNFQSQIGLTIGQIDLRLVCLTLRRW